MEILEGLNCSDRKQVCVCQDQDGRRKQTLTRHTGTLWSDRSALHHDFCAYMTANIYQNSLNNRPNIKAFYCMNCPSIKLISKIFLKKEIVQTGISGKRWQVKHTHLLPLFSWNYTKPKEHFLFVCFLRHKSSGTKKIWQDMTRIKQ